MKTLVIWDEVQAELQYFISNEDLSRFNGVYINMDGDEALANELAELIYDAENNPKVDFMDFPIIVNTIEFDQIIYCGFLP